MPFPTTTLCQSPEEVREAVAAMETAVALKVVSHEIPHKTEAGGMALGVVDADHAERAYKGIVSRSAAYLRERGLPPEITGVLVSPMLTPPVAELLVGAHRDPALGPVLTLAAGGVGVEVRRDVARRVLPVGRGDILEMLGELRIYGFLTGARGRECADIEVVVAAAQSVARCILEHADVDEVEVNPLFVYAQRAEAVDARIFLREASGSPPA